MARDAKGKLHSALNLNDCFRRSPPPIMKPRPRTNINRRGHHGNRKLDHQPNHRYPLAGGHGRKRHRILQTAPSTTPGSPGQLVSTVLINGLSNRLGRSNRESHNIRRLRSEDRKNRITVSTIQTVWMAYSGATAIETNATETQVVARGQMTYDAAAVAENFDRGLETISMSPASGLNLSR